MPYQQAFRKGREYLAKTAAISALCLAPIAAAWAQAPAFTLQVVRTGPGHVSSTSDPGPVFSGQINCGPQFAKCNTTYHPDTNVILTATPTKDTTFDGWAGCGAARGNECYVTMQANTTITARFSPVTSRGSACQPREFSEAEDTMLDAYIAYYGRPPDWAGLAGWADQLQRPDLNRNTVLSWFGQSEEYVERFGHLANRELINNLYNQIFGRSADGLGLDYYDILLSSAGKPLATIAMDILHGATNDDLVVLQNRRQVARHFVTVSEGRGVKGKAEDWAKLLSLVNLDFDSGPNAQPGVRPTDEAALLKINQIASTLCDTFTDLVE